MLSESSGILIKLKLSQSLKYEKTLNYTHIEKAYSDSLHPILNLDDDFTLIGLGKKFFKISNSKSSKRFSILKLPEKKFEDACVLYSNEPLILATSKQNIYFWKKNRTKKWNLNCKIFTKNKNNLITSINCSKIIITSHDDFRGVSLWKLHKKNLLYCNRFLINDPIQKISGSCYNEYFIIHTIKGYMQIYSFLGISIDCLCEPVTPSFNSLNHIQNSFDFFSSNLVLTGGTSKNLNLWDIRTKKIERCWQGHMAEIKYVDFSNKNNSSNKNQIISSDLNNVVKYWDIRYEKEYSSIHIPYDKITAIRIQESHI